MNTAFREERIVSKGLWPPRSPDLSTCEFYWYINLKGKVNRNHTNAIEDLKANIHNAIAEIT